MLVLGRGITFAFLYILFYIYFFKDSWIDVVKNIYIGERLNYI